MAWHFQARMAGIGHEPLFQEILQNYIFYPHFEGKDDSGILPLACIPAIHGGHAAIERARDGLEASL